MVLAGFWQRKEQNKSQMQYNEAHVIMLTIEILQKNADAAFEIINMLQAKNPNDEKVLVLESEYWLLKKNIKKPVQQ